jgi:hypothetical protein
MRRVMKQGYLKIGSLRRPINATLAGLLRSRIAEFALFRRIVMKSVALLTLVLCAFCGPAIAQTTECQSIPKASDRLACYDKAKPPMSKAKPAAASTTSSAPQGQPGDLLAAENARLDARINNICRGC